MFCHFCIFCHLPIWVRGSYSTKKYKKKNVTTEAEIASFDGIVDASEREFHTLSDAYRHFLRFAIFVLVRGKRNGIHSGPVKQEFLHFLVKYEVLDTCWGVENFEKSTKRNLPPRRPSDRVSSSFRTHQKENFALFLMRVVPSSDSQYSPSPEQNQVASFRGGQMSHVCRIRFKCEV